MKSWFFFHNNYTDHDLSDVKRLPFVLPSFATIRITILDLRSCSLCFNIPEINKMHIIFVDNETTYILKNEYDMFSNQQIRKQTISYSRQKIGNNSLPCVNKLYYNTLNFSDAYDFWYRFIANSLFYNMSRHN